MHVVPDNITREKCILLKAPRPLGLGPDFSWVELSVELSVELGIEQLRGAALFPALLSALLNALPARRAPFIQTLQERSFYLQ